MPLSGKEINRLRGLAHHLKPIVTVGSAGVTPAVKKELDIALNHHELVKIRLPGASKEDKKTALEELCRATDATPVQLIGRIGVVYRPFDTND